MDTFSPDAISQVRQKADLVEVIADKVVLRKQGRNYVGLCPFHQDRRPSFQVSPSKQIYKCFSCGAGGDVLRFVSQYERISFTEAVLQLAQRYRIPITARTPHEQKTYERQLSHQEKLLEVLALAADFYQHALRSPQGSPAQRYLEQRQLLSETIQRFQLGFAPPGWQSLYDYLVTQKRIPVKLLESAGLIVERSQGQGWYDRFRHRIMLPIFDLKGQIIGFAGRTLGQEHPKYLNSPETELFNKGQVLYGLNFARDAIIKLDQALVVEGYFDVISLHQAGISQAVAAMGTAIGSDQVNLLLRYTESKRVIFNFDADPAGCTAAERVIELLEAQAKRGEIELRILTIPQGKDADEYLRDHSPLAFQELLEEAPLWLDWQIDRILAQKNLSRASEFQQAHQALVKLLADLGGNWRTLYLHRVAERLSQGNGRLSRDLEEELRRSVRRYRWSPPQQTPSQSKGSRLIQSEFYLLQIFLHFDDYRSFIRQELSERDLQFSLPAHRHLWQQILELMDTEGDSLLTTLRTICIHSETLSQQLNHLLWLDENTRIALMRPQGIVRAAIANMELEIRQKRYRYWTQLWDQAFSQGETRLAQDYQDRIQEEYQAIRRLQKETQASAETSFAEGESALDQYS
jgi:DNA primase